MDILGEQHLNNDIYMTEALVPAVGEIKVSETTFTYGSATVYVKFSKNGKSLDDLLISYFKNLKQQ